MLHELTRSLVAQGHAIHIVVLEALGHFAEGLDQIATLHRVPTMSRGSMLYPARLAGVLRSIAPDVVHSHAGVWFKASRAARLAGLPFVVHTEHGRRVPDTWADRVIDNIASRSTDTVIAVSDALAQVLRTRVVQDPAKVMVITNGVDTDLLEPDPLRREAFRRDLGLPLDAPIIGSIGRLQPVKNYRLALEAFAHLPAERPGPAPLLVLVGDGDERGELEALARARGIAERVRFLGWRDQVERVYRAFDIFTMSSLSEGTSVSLLEAMSCGLPPVVTDVGGNRAVLGPALASLLVPSGDAAGLAAAWTRLLDDPDLRQGMALQARERIEAAFSLRQMVAAHEALYQSLLVRAPRRVPA